MSLPAPLRADALRERLQRQVGSSFAIARELGGGGSARVFLATEVALDRAVVLKVLPPELTHGIDAERFRREILIAARLQHPHLVPLLAAGAPDEDSAAGDAALRWFSMPFVEGQTLREHLATHAPLPVSDAVRLLRALASALAYAHGRGVMHRDIKPENILLSDGVAMIADFGVAKALDDAGEAALRAGHRITTASTTLGTPAYMAPEQIKGAVDVDHRADLYAFGCVAYELLTGVPPLLRGSLRATMAAQVDDQPVPVGQLRPDLPPSFDAIIMACLQKDPELRPTSGLAIVAVLDQVGSETRPPAESAGLREPAPVAGRVPADRVGPSIATASAASSPRWRLSVAILAGLVIGLIWQFLTTRS